MKVPFADLTRIHTPIKTKLDKAWNTVLEANNYILGEPLNQFEDAFASYSGSKFGIGVANGTDALQLALIALGLQKGDEVILPSHTFISTALAVSYAGATPVFAEIEEDSYLIDSNKIEEKITKKTKAILPVCLYGQPANMDDIQKLAKKHNLTVLVDDCQAHGALYKGKPMGSFGDAQAYSFYPGKNLGGFGDGGLLTTNNSKIEKNVRLLRNIGRTGWYEHPLKGYNSRLDTLQANILLTKLEFLDKWNTERQKAAAIYQKLLKDMPIILPIPKEDRSHVYHLYVIRTKKRKQFIEHMLKHDVHVSIHYPIPIHIQKAYSELKSTSLPITEKVAKEVVSLPIFPGITLKEQEYVAQTIKTFFKK
jgi:dTDP-4-amino-4,6-dideoxygalactose transaminase